MSEIEPDHKIKVASYKRHRRAKVDIREQLNKMTIGEAFRRAEQDPEGETYSKLLEKQDSHTSAAGIIKRDLQENKPPRNKKIKKA